MNEIELKKLWTVLQGKYDVGTFQVFKSNMDTTDKRKRFYNVITNIEHFDIGPYNDFEKRLSGGSSNTERFPSCVYQFGQPVLGPKNQISISGVVGGKQCYFFQNGRYYDVDSQQMGSYTCNGNEPVLGSLETTNTQELNPVSNNGEIPSANKQVNSTPTDITPQDIVGGKFVEFGMVGNIVGQIQQLLIKGGYKNISKTGQPDNKFGSRTLRAVKQFQHDNGIGMDGVVGPMTWDKLNGLKTNSGLKLSPLAPQDDEIQTSYDSPNYSGGELGDTVK